MQAWASESAEHAAKAAEHAADVAFYEDPTFWVALAFLIFFALAGKKMFGIATAGLDARAETIRTQIEEAQTLRDEAQQLLADNKRRHREAVEEAKEIVAKARAEAERMKDRAAKEL
ncbi:MAG: F0F1 ATP synthase subunit B, partial [Magnetospiraceae bacterium]